MRSRLLLITALLVVGNGSFGLTAGERRGPTVVIGPGDITPLRGNIVNPLGPSQVYRPLPPLPEPGAAQIGRDLERELDRLQSRPPAGRRAIDDGPRLDLTSDPLGRQAVRETRDRIDRARAAEALEAFKTLRPNAPETPLLERDLDRVQRPTDLGQ